MLEEIASTGKGKFCVILFLALTLPFTAVLMLFRLSQVGCLPHIGFWGHVEDGLGSLVFGGMAAAIVSALLFRVLRIPDDAERIRKWRERKRSDRKRREEVSAERVAAGYPPLEPVRAVDPEDLKRLGVIAVVLVAIAAAVIGLGWLVGWTVWRFAC